MSNLTVRNIEPLIKDKLRLRAAAHGHSMAEDVPCFLRQAMTQVSKPAGLGSCIHERFAVLAGIDLPLPERVALPRFASFEEGRCFGNTQRQTF